MFSESKIRDISIIILCFAIFIVGCKKQSDEQMQNISKGIILKISILQSGKVLVNSNESSLQDIEKRLLEIKDKNGVVWYYRENPQEEPTDIAMKIIELVVKYKVPISFSSKPDFSDTIDEHGASHPRK